MAARDMRGAIQGSPSILETNKVLKNTYLLLSATLAFSALMASICVDGSGYVCIATNSEFDVGPGRYLSGDWFAWIWHRADCRSIPIVG